MEPGRKGIRYLCRACRADRRERIARTSRTSRRRRVPSHYGGSAQLCAECGEANVSFLALDHMEPVGASVRRELGSGENLLGSVGGNNYPDGFQVPCHDCNVRKGPVPHSRPRAGVSEA
jgi:hypothetical protein